MFQFFSFSSCQGGGTGNWERTEPGQLTWTGRRVTAEVQGQIGTWNICSLSMCMLSCVSCQKWLASTLSGIMVRMLNWFKVILTAKNLRICVYDSSYSGSLLGGGEGVSYLLYCLCWEKWKVFRKDCFGKPVFCFCSTSMLSCSKVHKERLPSLTA